MNLSHFLSPFLLILELILMKCEIYFEYNTFLNEILGLGE